MAVISAKLSIGEIECMLGIRYTRTTRLENKTGPKPHQGRFSRSFQADETPTARDFTLSPGERMASAIASATIVRDVAALGAMVLFGTMLMLILGSADLFV